MRWETFGEDGPGTRVRTTRGEVSMKKLLMTGIALGAAMMASAIAHAEIKLGVAGPITGPNAAFGAQLTNGVQQAVEDLNAKGGILGQKVVVVSGDDVSDPKQGVSVANKFIGDG